MKLNKFDNIVVLGSGTIAAQCIKQLRETVGGEVHVFEKKQSNSSILEKRLSTMSGIYYSEIGLDIEHRILQISPKIIFSINNIYIFSESLANSFPILNYHNSLLPKHPGRNAEAWTIFSQDRVTGVTWHFVDGHVDTGNIALQREIPLSADITSIQLLSVQTKVAYRMFEEILDCLCKGGELPCKKQEKRENIKFHFSWEKPNHGELDLSWDIPRMYAFLRAMDYGKLAMLGVPKLTYQDRSFTWQRYSLAHTAEESDIQSDLTRQELHISRGGNTIRLAGLQICE